MIIVKLIGAFLLISIGILTYLLNKKQKTKDGPLKGIVQDSIIFKGYLLALVLIFTGLGLIISVFI